MIIICDYVLIMAYFYGTKPIINQKMILPVGC